MNNNKMKFNGKSDNRNNRTTDFDIKKADIDNDGDISSYEATRARAINKAMKEQKNKKSLMSTDADKKEFSQAV